MITHDGEKHKIDELEDELTAAQERITTLEHDLDIAKGSSGVLPNLLKENKELALRVRELELIKFNWNEEIQPLRDRVRSLEALNLFYRSSLEAVGKWYGLDGDGITEPVRSQVKEALLTPSPVIEELREVYSKASELFIIFQNTTISHPGHWHEKFSQLNEALSILKSRLGL